jgi:hypothetical protein
MAINPLQPPINYAGMVPQVNIAQQFAEFGQVLVDRQKRVQAEKVKEEYKTDLQAAIANPTQETWSNMIAKYPQQREAFAEARKGYGDVAATNEFNQGFQLSMALENDRPEIARELVTKIIVARKDKNMPTGIYEQTLDALVAGNIKGAQAGVNYALSVADPDRFKKQVDARTAAAKAPSEVTEAAGKAAKSAAEGQVAAGTVDAKIKQEKAAADEALAKARVAVATAPDAIAKAAAEKEFERAKAEKEKIDAQFARQKALADLDKQAADLGLTKEQKNKVLAETKKLGQETAKITLELEALKASGGIDAEKKFEKEGKFRKEYSDQTKGYQETKSAYGRILAVSDPKSPDEEAAADLALIFNFMKMQDPGSTINTGEFANAQNAAGVPDRIRNLYNNLVTGARLNPTQRNSFRGQAENLYKAAGQQEDTVRKGITRIAQGYGLNIENIFYTATEVAPTAVSGTPAANPNTVKVGDMTYTRPPNFTDKQWSDYKQSVGAK